MAVSLTSGAPELIEQGGTYIFEEQFSNYPHTSWTSQYVLQIPGSAPYTTNATNGTGNNNFIFTLDKTATANWTPGHYTFAIYATEMSSSQRATAKTGVTNIIPDLSQTQAPS